MRIRYKRILWWLLGVGFGIGLLLFWWMLVMLGELRVFVPHTGTLLGIFGQEKRYLVVFQNNEEARPTGGFVTAYGFLEVAGGFPKNFTVADVYSLQGYRDERVRPMPAPMEFFFEDPFFRGYSFHDGNWSPDFPTSAQEMMRLYQEDEEDITIDGVIAVNFSFVENLLDAVGGVVVEDTRYTKENFFTLVEFEVNNMDRHNVEALANRKNVLAEVQKQLLKKAFGNPLQWGHVFALAGDALAEKNIQLYFVDERVQQTVLARRWGGQVWQDRETHPRDIFMVNVANLGAGKSDRYVRKNYTYDVRLEDTPDGPKATARVNLVFRHLGDQNIPVSFRYRAWVRTYLPKGTKLLSDTRGVTVDTEFGHRVLGQMIEVDPGKVGYLSYEVELPTWIRLGLEQYKLYVNPQSASDAEYHISVHFPMGSIARSTDMTTVDNIAYFDGALTGERVLEAYFLPDALPPRVSAQRFEDLNRIVIEFNEPIDQKFCSSGFVTIEDLNVNVPNETNTDIRFREVQCTDRRMVLLTRGITAQKEEHFRVILRGFTDLNGNVMEPAEKAITVVQRF